MSILIKYMCRLIVDDGKIKMVGAGTFHCISTMSLHIYFIKIDIFDILLTCISVVQDRKTYLCGYLYQIFLNQ